MKYIQLVCMLLLVCTGIQAQYTIQLSIKHNTGRKPLSGATATIDSLDKIAVADSIGLVQFYNMPAGAYTISVSYVGMATKTITLQVPANNMEVLLEEAAGDEEEDEEVVIRATRVSRSITDIPTRVETISGEELSEKSNMKPGDIRMVLSESTGIQTQQTSATSYNSSIRIQGLDGRYTQLLRDGLPLYAGFSGGLGLMQVAPLDLQQIEVIKGSSSTLYGGGAIAGLVNLVSKTPETERELNFLVNATSALGLDLGGFYSQRFKQVGVTVFGSGNFSSPYDPADIGLTAIPKVARYTINPRLFMYGNKTTANIGFSYITENRTGGNMDYIKHDTDGYYEKNNTQRFSTQAAITHILNEHSQLNFKNSYSRFNRRINIPGYTFKGLQQSTFSELNYSNQHEQTQVVLGANLVTDDFNETPATSAVLRNYSVNTIGAFAEYTLKFAKLFTAEAGLRGDYVNQYGFLLLPRASLMIKPTSKLTARLGGGLGYKTPSVFNEESEQMQFQHILPIDEDSTVNERSAGCNFDINYRIRMGEVGFTINQMFFYTRLNKPLVLTPNGVDYEFVNAPGHIDTRGFETNLRFTYSNFKMFIGYTYADVNDHYNNIKSWRTLSARHRLNNVLMYEQEGKLKIGLEAYYVSPQKLSDGTGQDYWTFGIMGEKIWKHISIFLNFENFTDTRQTKFDTIYTGTIDDPTFRDIYAPVDGFVINGGIKIRM